MNAGELVYDGDCGFCTACALWLQRGGVAVVPWQRLDLAAVGLTEEQVRSRVYWLQDARPADSAAGAVGLALVDRGGPWRPVWRLIGRLVRSRPVRPLAEVVYRLVARNRHRLPGSTCAY